MTETVMAANSKSEQAYAAVKSRIVEGTYTPGYRLVLAKIAEDLGFSVVPVREAIRRLEAEGLVKFENFGHGRKRVSVYAPAVAAEQLLQQQA